MKTFEEAQVIVEAAVDTLCNTLDVEFPGADSSSPGITSNFQGLLVKHVAAMLQGKPSYKVQTQVTLPELVGPEELARHRDGLWRRLNSVKDTLREAKNMHLQNNDPDLDAELRDIVTNWSDRHDAMAEKWNTFVKKYGKLL